MYDNSSFIGSHFSHTFSYFGLCVVETVPFFDVCGGLVFPFLCCTLSCSVLVGEATAIHTNLYCGLNAGEGGIINIHLPLIHNTSHDNICDDDKPQRFCDYSICQMGFINNIDQNNNMILKRTNKSAEDIIESPPYFRLKACSQTSVFGL